MNDNTPNKGKTRNNKKKSPTPRKAKIVPNSKFIPYTPFNFADIDINEITPEAVDLWKDLLKFKYEEIYCFINSNLVCCKPNEFQLRINPDLDIQSKLLPMKYWATCLYIPELEYYLCQHQNTVFLPNKTTEGEIVTKWVPTRADALDELHNFLDLYETHHRTPMNITQKLPSPIVQRFYSVLYGVVNNLGEAYLDQYNEGGWEELQVNYFNNFTNKPKKVNKKSPNKQKVLAKSTKKV